MPDLTPDEELRREQEREYGQFTANKPIHIRGGLAFNVGDPVPASHVERGVVSADDVNKVRAAKSNNPTTGSEA